MTERCLRIQGGNPLEGTINISGAKNAVLPCLFATLLTDELCELTNIPSLTDTQTTLDILEELGHKYDWNKEASTIQINPGSTDNVKVPLDKARVMRASILALGPLLAKRGKAKLPLPGGCDFGSRPIDIHLAGFKALGAKIYQRGGVLYASVEKELVGTHIILDFPTFTGTENLLLAATLAKGQTVIENAAQEPEVSDLAHMLNNMGADIQGIGTSVLTINGVDKLAGTKHDIIADRIEAGSYLMAVMATGGKVTLTNVVPTHLSLPIEKFKEAGATIKTTKDTISLTCNKRPKAFNIVTAPYPGYPTDLQAQTLAVNSIADGTAEIVDQVWQQRFRTADELELLGAKISVHGNCATVTGVKSVTRCTCASN